MQNEVKNVEKKKLKLIWVSSAPWLNSGYGKCCNYIAGGLAERGHIVFVHTPHIFGVLTLGNVTVLGKVFVESFVWDIRDLEYWVTHINPNVTVIHYDVWVYPTIETIRGNFILYLPIDSELDEYTHEINRFILAKNVTKIITFCKFGYEQVRKILTLYGVDKPVSIVPHGVDLSIFHMYTEDVKDRLRRELNLEGKVVFTSVVANIGDRKDIPTLLKGFKLFLEQEKAKDAVLILWTNTFHVRGISYDIARLVKRYGLTRHVILPTPQPPYLWYGDTFLAKIYNVSDWSIFTTSGEGFLLPALESMACGVPIIAPSHTALLEHLGIDKPVEKVVETERGIAMPYHIERPTLWTPTHQEYKFTLPQTVAEALSLAYHIDPSKYREKVITYARQHDWNKIIDKIENELINN